MAIPNGSGNALNTSVNNFLGIPSTPAPTVPNTPVPSSLVTSTPAPAITLPKPTVQSPLVKSPYVPPTGVYNGVLGANQVNIGTGNNPNIITNNAPLVPSNPSPNTNTVSMPANVNTANAGSLATGNMPTVTTPVTPTTTSTAAAGLQGSINAAQTQYQNETAANAAAAAVNLQKSGADLSSIEGQFANFPATAEGIYQANGVDAATKAKNDAAQAILQEQTSLQHQVEALHNGTGVYQGEWQQAGSDQEATLRRTSADYQANLAVIQQAANNNYDLATSIAQRQITNQLAPLEDQLTAATTFFNANKDLFTTQEAAAYQSKIDQLSQTYTQLNNQKSFDYTNALNAIQTSNDNIVNQGLDPATVYQAQSDLLSGKITLSQFYKTIGMQQPAGDGTPSTGAGTGATNAAAAISKATGTTIDTTQPLSTVIQQAGMQNVVNGIIQSEGGSVAGVQNNPGNIKFAGLPGQTDSGVAASDGGTYANYATPDAGMQAIASQVQYVADGKSHIYGANPTFEGFMNTYSNTAPTQAQTASAQSTAKANGSASSYDQVVAAAPVNIGNSIMPLPDGSAYIDTSKLADPKFALQAQRFAAQHGIRVISGSDASTVQAATTAIKQLGQISSSFSNLATGTVGTLLNSITNPASKLLDTNYGSELKAYQSDRQTLIGQIRALAQSSPRINATELETAANSLPVLSGGSKDTLKDGINKLVKTQSYIDNAISTTIPGYVGTPVSIGNQFAVLGSDGKTYMFNDAASATTFLTQDKK